MKNDISWDWSVDNSVMNKIFEIVLTQVNLKTKSLFKSHIYELED